MKMKKTSNRCYVIRFFDEKSSSSKFYSTSSYRGGTLVSEISHATAYETHKEAGDKIVELSKEKSKTKGYYYIAKAFGIKGSRYNRYSREGETITPTKLTKPDRHDFLSAI
jgi:hypothetical protein